MNRYAILRDPNGDHLPMGVAVEREGHVAILAADEYGLPKRISEPYCVLGRDLTKVEYRPGDSAYFDQVLVELQRIASIGNRGELPDASDDALITLFNAKVVKPRVAAPREYVAQTATWSSERRPWRIDVKEPDEDDGARPRVAA